MLLTLAAALDSNEMARAQYAWDTHFGPQPTGFELHRFGNWELEMIAFRGMIDRAYYESDRRAELGVRRVHRTVTRFDRDGTRRVIHESTSLVDASGRMTATLYLNPHTHQQVQRESFKYDDGGRLVEWRPVKDPGEVAVASIAQTTYPGRLPYGRYQTFRYNDDGSLAEWRACNPGRERRSRRCDEAYIRFDSTGRISEFVSLEETYRLERDEAGNLSRVTATRRSGRVTLDVSVRYDDIVIRERHATKDSSIVENIATRDSRGRIVQYKTTSPANPDYYSTTTWEYDESGRLSGITRGLDRHDFGYNESGNLVSVDQSVLPASIRRTYDPSGRIIEQTPPMSYNRYDLVDTGTERISYTNDGLLASIRVFDATGNELGVVSFEYEYASRAQLRP